MNALHLICFLAGAGVLLAAQVFAGLWLNARVTTGTICQQCGEAITQHPQGWRCKRCAAVEEFCAGGDK